MVDVSVSSKTGCLGEHTLDALGRGGLTPAERERAARHLDACADCREVLACLKGDAGPAGGGAPGPSLPPPSGGAQRLPAGTRVGRYTVLHEVGRGSMGVVYAAYDPAIDRRVALKLVHPALLPGASREGAASRLLREAQAVGRLAHPGVITAFDAGRFDGHVFFAMEFVDGDTLGAWVRAAARTRGEVLAAFLAAGRGLAAAHAAGLVHRDFKPDNVLVGRDGRVRVTDFGLVRVAAGPEGGDGDAGGACPLPAGGTATRTGALVGTPAYLAPEVFRGAPADARSDQFSFCVALYEALHGARPFETSEGWGGRLGARGRESSSWGRRVPAPVQRAIARGLAVRPGDRFPSMAALLAALERGEGARRRHLGLAAGLALAALGAAGLALGGPRAPAAGAVCGGARARLAGAWDDARRGEVRAAFAKSAAAHAPAAWAATERLLDRYADGWADMHEQACEATHVRGEQSGELLDLRMECLGRRREELRALTSLLAGADDDALAQATRAASALRPLGECASREALTSPLRLPADPAARAQIGAVRGELAEAAAELAMGRYEQSGARAGRALEAAAALAFRPLEAEAALALALAHVRLEEPAAAGPALHRALQAAEASGHLTIAARAELSLAFSEGTLLRRHAQGHVWVDLAGATLERLGDAPLIATERLVVLGNLLYDEGRANDAVPAFERALALQEAAFGPDHPSVATTMSRLAMVQATRERFDEAIDLARRALAAEERLLGPDHPGLSARLHSVAFVLFMAGRAAESRSHMERCLALEERAFGADHPTLVKTLIVLSNLQDAPAAAIALLERARAAQERAAAPSQPDLAIIYKNLAISLDLLGRHREQLASAERALALEDALLGPEHPERIETLLLIGRAHAKLGRPAQGLPFLERGLALARSHLPTDAYSVGRGTQANARQQLAEALWQMGRERARARALMLDALSIVQAGGAETASARAEIETWLARHGVAVPAAGGAGALAGAPVPAAGGAGALAGVAEAEGARQ
jgi:eukaryotic-like serine/threonine-protein kinase